jgi:hypothetical protein
MPPIEYDRRIPELHVMCKESREDLYFGARIGVWLLNHWYLSRLTKPRPSRVSL